MPDVANALLERIPRLEPLVQIVTSLKWNDAQLAKLGEGTIGLGAKILGAVIDYEALVTAGKSREQTFANLHRKAGRCGLVPLNFEITKFSESSTTSTDYA